MSAEDSRPPASSSAEGLLVALSRGDLHEARRLARLALADPEADLRAAHLVLGRLEAALGDATSRRASTVIAPTHRAGSCVDSRPRTRSRPSGPSCSADSR